MSTDKCLHPKHERDEFLGDGGWNCNRCGLEWRPPKDPVIVEAEAWAERLAQERMAKDRHEAP